MRVCILVSFLVLVLGFEICSAEEPSPTKSEAGADGPSVKEILRQASGLAGLKNEQQRYVSGNAQHDILKVQLRAADFEGAQRTISDYGLDSELAELAKGLAGAGQ